MENTIQTEKREGASKVGAVFMGLIAVVVIAVGVGIMMVMVKNPVEATKEERRELIPRVETVTVDEINYTVQIATQGQVLPVTQTQIISEVGGSVTYVSDKLKAGGAFAKGEEMVRLEQADYEATLANAKAQVADAKLNLAQEEARAEQALREWKKLGRGEQASDLVLRKPQIESAKARLESSEAAVNKAVRDLERTVTRAPYDCIVESANIDEGGYVAPGGRIAEVYASQKMELRLPLSLEDVGFLPEEFKGTEVTVRAVIGGKPVNWQGKIVRSEGGVDRETMTMMMVVEVTPKQGEQRFALPPKGLFVNGEFQGEKLEGVVRVPRQALTGEGKVYVMGDDNTLRIVAVEVERTERDYVIVTKGLEQGDQVITSPIELPVEGMKVEPVKQKGLK
ncbi:RND family efflux transporter, MFP subunit [Rubritalea squalenifaciens DSM 18772]|uniref:RND family efflux transporter, MFP subunit n=1 Tax=Rubritalea squalenifaciens DSM 18772 TaxID=1123071 RepID=A0A1M6H8V5_9BACT|nr:efflux RND transporter periplasmic adaptor subunit [Rubritalea squalenifaciens]SHJ18644.1 RND family efflux transporter, MFP subunit [Rubritalea squalenifaciens DSM 18772]